MIMKNIRKQCPQMLVLFAIAAEINAYDLYNVR